MENYNHFFTSSFVENSPKIILNNYNNKLSNSLLSLFNSVENSIELDLSEIKKLLNKIKVEKKLNPKIYALHAFLQEAIKQGEGNKVIRIINQIDKFFKQDNLYAQLFSIQSVSIDDWEQRILKDLKEQNRNKEGNLSILNSVEDNDISIYGNVQNFV